MLLPLSQTDRTSAQAVTNDACSSTSGTQAILVQVRPPYDIGLFSDRGRSRHGWSWFAYRLFSDASNQQLASAHAAQSAVCVCEVVPLHLTAEQNRRLRTVCQTPTLSISANVVEFLLEDVMDVNSTNTSRHALKQEHIRELVHNPEFWQP